jgi:hypothetical protein
MLRSRVSLAALAALGVTGVGATAVVATSAPAAGAPTITSLKATQRGNAVTVAIKTKNFRIAAMNVGGRNQGGQGHEHFALDGGRYDFPRYSGANGKIARQLGVAGQYSPSLNDKVVYRGLPKGRHRVTVFLVHNDHTNRSNRGSRKTLTFRVR